MFALAQSENVHWSNKPRLLVAIMALCIAAVTGTAVSLLYQTALQQQKMRLVEVAQSRAQLIQAMGRYEAQIRQTPASAAEESITLAQVREAHQGFGGFGDTGEFTLGTRTGTHIHFLLSHRHDDLDTPRPVPWQDVHAEPMRRALQGQSGTLIGLDYRGETVLAAHEPLPQLGWGIVAKIDLAEIRQPFVRASLFALGISLVAIIIGAWLFFRVTSPMVQGLVARELSLASIIKTAVDGIICIDRQGVVEAFNPAAEKMFGYTAAEVIGQKVNMLMPADQSAGHDEHLQHFLATDTKNPLRRHLEVEAQRKNGERFPLQLAVSEVRDTHGKVISFTGIARDMTQERAVQDELRQHAMVFANASEAIMIISPHGEVNQVNPACGKITGYASKALLGKNADQLFGLPRNRAQLAKIKSALDSGGHWQGDIWARGQDSEVFPVGLTTTSIVNDHGKVTQSIWMFTDISERKLAEDQMRYLAQHDPLTGLANRALFQDRCTHALQRAHRGRGRFALIYMDLDEFKPVNDKFGHTMGDELLCEIAGQLQQLIREDDTLARMGGDEFALLMEDVESTACVDRVMKKLTRSLSRNFEIQGHSFRIGVSIGHSLYPDDGRDIATLLGHADAAMYRMKRALEKDASPRTAAQAGTRSGQ